VHYLRQAGLKAMSRSALRAGRAWFEQALSALAELSESTATLEQGFDIRLDLRPALVQLGDIRQARECLEEAASLP